MKKVKLKSFYKRLLTYGIVLLCSISTALMGTGLKVYAAITVSDTSKTSTIRKDAMSTAISYKNLKGCLVCYENTGGSQTYSYINSTSSVEMMTEGSYRGPVVRYMKSTNTTPTLRIKIPVLAKYSDGYKITSVSGYIDLKPQNTRTRIVWGGKDIRMDVNPDVKEADKDETLKVKITVHFDENIPVPLVLRATDIDHGEGWIYGTNIDKIARCKKADTTVTDATYGTTKNSTVKKVADKTYEGTISTNYVYDSFEDGSLLSYAAERATIWAQTNSNIKSFDMTYYAKGARWASISYSGTLPFEEMSKLFFDFNGVTPTNLDAAEVTYLKNTGYRGYDTTTLDIPANIANPTATGYTFNGWTLGPKTSGQTKYGSWNASTRKFTFGEHYALLTAKWTAHKYTVTYYGNGNTNTVNPSPYTSSHTYGTSSNLTANKYKREFTVGFNGNGVSNPASQSIASDFKHWNTQANDAGTLSFVNSASVKNLTATNNGNVNLYAIWTDKSITLPTVSRTGYTFDGWYDGNTRVGGNGGSYKVTKNVTLVAKWTPVTYTVTFKHNKPTNMTSTIGGRADNSTVTVKYDHTDNNSVTTCSATGWVFQGWYDSTSGGTKVYDASGNAVASNGYWSASKTWVKASGVTVYAQWKPIEYDIVYDKNKPAKASHDVTGTTNSSHHVYDVDKALTTNGYSLVGWRFSKWNTKSDGTGNSYSDKQSVKNLTATNGAKVTLYAQWIQNTYTVNIYETKPSNASHNVERVTTPSGWTWSTDHWTKTFTYDDTKIGYTPSQLFKLKGWTIDGTYFYSSSNGTGTQYTKDSWNLTATHGATVNLYVKWTANKYNIYYDKGLTTDTTTTTITDATRNTNIQQTGTNRPYTTATYDSSVIFAKIGSLKGREYKLQFNSNKPSSIPKQKSNNTANPTSVSTISGNLTSKNNWQISGQDSDVTTNLTPTMGSTISKPNYKDANNASCVGTALWNSKVLNGFSTPTLAGWTFVGWYDNQAGSNSTVVSNTTDMIREVNTSSNVSPNTSVTAKNNVISFTVQPKTTNFEQTLYARWQRTITLTFNMNGGEYIGDSSNVTLTGVYYNNADGYEFSINDTLTAANLPNYEQQQKTIDAYGTFDANGENDKYTKVDYSTGVTYRFLGWSLSSTATKPDDSFIVYDSGHKLKYRVYDNTTLYAVWEPILLTNIRLDRTLGQLTFTDGTSVKNYVNSLRSSSGTKNIGVVAKPGEQCSYTIVSRGNSNVNTIVIFDTRVTDIYDKKGTWTDKLNPNTGTGEETSTSNGLNRQFTLPFNGVTRKFYVPQYIGTKKSYSTSVGIDKFVILFEVYQDSYYYKYVYNKKEQQEIIGTVYISTDKEIATKITEGTPSINPSLPQYHDPIVSVLDELRSELKIRLH